MGKVPRLLLVRCAALSLAVSGARGSSANVIEDSCYVRRFGVEGRLQFCLQDRVKHPLFSWPRTLLSYPVRFEEANVEPDQLVLRNLETGQEVPFQLSDVRTRHGRLLTATVNFFADLPSGAKGTFELSQAQGTPERARPSVKMKETRQSGSIVLDAGVLKVRIPVSQKTPQGQDVPGPIVQLQREDGPRRRSSQSEGGGIGESHIISSRKPIREIVSERVESGDLFITYRLTYQFAGGATYAATVRSVLGHDFVEFLEEMKGLPRGDGVTLEQAWTGFDPTHRFSSSWPYPMGGGKPFKKERSGSYGDYDWVGIDEPIIITNTANGRGPQQTEDPAEEFAFRLAPYAPAVLWEINPHATFWDERGGDSLGVFIQHHEKWNDLEYSLWSSSDILPVRFRYTGKKLYWTWPLVTGTRATGLAYYTHEKDTAAMHDQERNAEELVSMKISAGDALKMTQFPATYTSFLHNRLGAISLNRVKDWVLEYDERHGRPPALFTEGLIGGADEYERRLRPCAFGGPA